MDPIARIVRALDLVTREDGLVLRQEAILAAAQAVGRHQRTVRAWLSPDPAARAEYTRTQPPTDADAEAVEAAMRALALNVRDRAQRAADSI